MNYWDIVDGAREVIETSGLQLGKAHGLARYFDQTEGVAAMIQQAALDFLSTEFKGFPKELVVRDLSDREDELYPKWVDFAEKIYGIRNHAAQETGWEMIMGGPYADPGLTTDFPKRGALHQSKENSSLFLSKREQAATMPWSPKAKELARRADVRNYMGGHLYVFPNFEMYQNFKKAIGVRESRRAMRESFEKFIVHKGKYRVLEPDTPIFSHMKIDELMAMTGSEIRNLWMHHLPADVLFGLGDFFNDKQLNALAAHPDKEIARDALDALA